MTLWLRSTIASLNQVTGLQDITIPGIGTPSFARLVWTQADTINAEFLQHQIGIGMTDGSTPVVMGSRHRHGVSTSETISYRRAGAAEIVWMVNQTSTAIQGAADFVSFITDGIRINVTDAFAGSRQVLAQFIGGTDLLDIQTGEFSLDQAQDTAKVLDLGFVPSFALFSGCRGALNGTTAYGDLGVGMFNNLSGVVEQGVGTFSCNSDVSFNGALHRLRNDRVLVRPNDTSSTTAIDMSAEVTAIVSGAQNGLEFTKRNGATNGVIQYAAFRVQNHNTKLFFFQDPLATGNADFTGVGFQPQAGIFHGARQDTLNADERNRASVAHGIVDSAGTEFVINGNSQDNTGTKDERNEPRNDRVLLKKTNATPPVANSQATFVSWLADGFRLNYTAVALNQFWNMGLFIEETAVAVDAAGRITWTQLEYPDVGDAAGRVTWAELQYPDPADAVGRVTWAQLEYPDALDAAGRVTWSQFRYPEVGESQFPNARLLRRLREEED